MSKSNTNKHEPIISSTGRKYQPMDLKGKAYLQVADRIELIRDELGKDGVGWKTRMVKLDLDRQVAVFKATVFKHIEGGRIILSEAHGSESIKDFGDYIEKAETKAVGRAIAYAGYGTRFVGDELDEGDRIVDAPAPEGSRTVTRHNYTELPKDADLQKKELLRAELLKLAVALGHEKNGSEKLRANIELWKLNPSKKWTSADMTETALAEAVKRYQKLVEEAKVELHVAAQQTFS